MSSFTVFCALLLLVTHSVSAQHHEHGFEYPGKHCTFEGYHVLTQLKKLHFANTTFVRQPCPGNAAPLCDSKEVLTKESFVAIKRRFPFSRKGCCPGFKAYHSEHGEVSCTEPLGCFISLPHETSKKCKKMRANKLNFERNFYPLDKRPKYYTLTTATFKKIAGRYLFDKRYAKLMTFQGILQKKVSNPYLKTMLKKFGKLKELKWKHYYIFYKGLSTAFQKISKVFKNFRQPSLEIPNFPNVGSPSFLRSDDYFVQLRLAGMHPLSIRRVYVGSSHRSPKLGMRLSKLTRLIGRKKLADLVKKSLKMTVVQAVRQNFLYVSDFPEMRNLPNLRKKGETGRLRLTFREPLAIFASVSRKSGKRKLKVLAIQEFYGKKSSLVTPKDKGRWLIAKIAYNNVETAWGIIVEHSFETHRYLEQFCLALERQLSDRHPLKTILQYHCRGTLEANSLLFRTFLRPKGIVDRIYPFPARVFNVVGHRRAKTWTYRSRLHNKAMEDKGVDDTHALPYYPYRDDARKVSNTLKEFGCAVVKTIYRGNHDIVDDYELQDMVKELSAKANGKVKGLPPRFRTIAELCDLTEEIFDIVVKHAAVNFAHFDYGTFVPLFPASIFRGNGKAFLSMLPNAVNSITQAYSRSLFSGFRLDSLLDYAEHLPEENLRKVARKYYFKIRKLTKQLFAINIQRGKKKYIPYPYLIPVNIPNSVHA